MPVIQITISQGRSVEQKRELVKVLSVLLLQIGNVIITCFADLKRISSINQRQQTQFFDKLQNKPFWIWDQQQHRLEDIKTNGYCCFNHRTDVSPKVFILAGRTCGNPTFNSHLISCDRLTFNIYLI